MSHMLIMLIGFALGFTTGLYFRHLETSWYAKKTR